MGTVNITSSGFASLPGSVPNNWPSNLTWPAGGSINGNKSYTISDADIQLMLSWIATTYNAQLAGNNPPPVSVPAVGIVLAWLNGFMAATTNAVQRHHVTPATVPPPISIA